MNESRLSGERVPPSETQREESSAAPGRGEPELHPDWQAEDRHFLIRLNASSLPRAAISALGTTLPFWRSLDSPDAVLRVAAERSERPSPRRGTARKHAKIALEAYRASRRLNRAGAAAKHLDAVETGDSRASPPIEITTCAERSYPARLNDLPLPPPVLFHRGELPSGAAIAIVGSRRADRYGREVAHHFAHALAERGLPIISGFARGIDQTAHRGALSGSHGTTVAVLGCGLDIDYPTGSQELASEIATRGAMISEFPPETGPMRQNFPVRNRIIAALAVGTLVIQGTERSGSLITARLALELGRDVYAVPGRVTDKLSSGTNLLIRDGAFPALSPEDVLDTLASAVQMSLLDPPEPTLQRPKGRDHLLADDTRAERASPTPPQDLPPVPDHLQPILDQLDGQATPLENLALAVDLPMERLLGVILELELGGWIERLPGPAVRIT